MAMLTKEDVLGLLNGTGLASSLITLNKALAVKCHAALLGNVQTEVQSDNPRDIAREQDKMILNSVGPAAAATAVEMAFTILHKSGKFKKLKLTNNYANNLGLVQNDEGYCDFSNTMRQFLLPRYAMANFDNMVDPRHQVDKECGYPNYITPAMYRYMYDRDDMARRVNDIYPDESWGADPEVWDDEDEKTDSPFERRWQELCEDHGILQMMYRADKLAGVGHYGAILVGVNDGDGGDLAKPINEADLLKGLKRSVGKKQRDLLYLRPFDEYLSFVQAYETDTSSPRCGKPVLYSLVFLDLTVDAAGASIGTRRLVKVHWTRIIHIADGLGSSLVFGTPRQQPVFNRLLDLRKIKGGSGEMFWKGGFPGISFEINPEYAADNPEFNSDVLKEEVEAYSNGLQRYLRLIGITAKSLNPQIADPKSHVMVQVQAIATHGGIPLRVFLGSEEGRLASSQDKQTWNQRLKRRLKMFCEPDIIRNLIDRFIAVGIMPPPKNGRYYVGWGDLNAPTDEDKANLSLKWTQALAQYVSSGIIHMIEPMDYMTTILGLPASKAKKMIAAVENKGGWAKLLKVDPSQGSGVNGTRQNITKKDSNKERGGRKKRDTNTKRTEGRG